MEKRLQIHTQCGQRHVQDRTHLPAHTWTGAFKHRAAKEQFVIRGELGLFFNLTLPTKHNPKSFIVYNNDESIYYIMFHCIFYQTALMQFTPMLSLFPQPGQPVYCQHSILQSPGLKMIIQPLLPG